MRTRRLAEDFYSLAASIPDQIAIVDAHGQTITYGQLQLKVQHLVTFLSQNGIYTGRSVAVLKEKSADTIACFLAILHCGATYIPFDPALSTERIQLLLRDADPDAFICDQRLFPSELPCQGDICSPVPEVNDTVIIPFSSGEKKHTNLAYILYTSGSTGVPKGVCISHNAASAFVDWSLRTFAFNTSDQVASIAPFHFDLSVMDIYATLMAGATLHLFSPEQIRNPRLMSQLFGEKKLSVVYATPTFFTTLVQFGKLEKHQSSLQRVLFAGEVFPVDALHRLMQLWSTAHFYNLYGPTETNVCVYTEIVRDEKRTQPYPIGRLCDGHEMEISAEGELWVGGPHVANGYLNRDELTASRFFIRKGTHWFKTGDIVETDSSGLLIFRGRNDRMIKRRGYRIEPAEIERALNLHPHILQGFAVPVQSNEDDLRLVAFVHSSDKQKISLVQLKEFLSPHIPDYMLPDDALLLDEIPVTSTGKTDYEKMKLLYTQSMGKV